MNESAIQVVMPQMGESLAEGTIVRWLKAPGDRVERDESLFEISTDKVDTDVPAPAAGVLKAILAREGDTVHVGAPVALIEPEGAERAAAPAPVAAAAPASVAPTEDPGGHFKSSHAPQLVSFRRDRGSTGGPATTPVPRPVAAERPRARSPVPANRSYSPAVLGAAQRAGVPLDGLTTMHGSGRGGRLTKRDVQRFIDSGGATAAPRSAERAAGDSAVVGEFDAPAEYRYRPSPADRLEPMSPVRRKSAHHMAWSVRISPHATAQAEVDMSAIAQLLEGGRESFRERTGAPLTYTVFAAAAAVRALRDFPSLNSSVVGDQLAFKPSVNLGVAVALPDSEELIVPVVRRAEELTLTGLARALHDVATRARARQLRPEDVQGGTFTLTNPGIFGGITGTPILNQPQVGILGLGAVRKQAVVVEDAIAVRPMMAVALTFDHRAADGMVAFRYLARLRDLLEAPLDEWR
jgi:2-oxoglutarate dehydrogenase E2 component (dihydrolipoamide succinyltransferase)